VIIKFSKIMYYLDIKENYKAMINRLLWKFAGFAPKAKKGATEVEYFLIIALVSVLVISALISMSTQFKNVFKSVYDAIVPVQQIMMQ
jgi:Flp pilus assembly pilin Flp